MYTALEVWVEWGPLIDLTSQRCFVFKKLFLILTKAFLFQMKWCKELLLTLLFCFMMLSCAKENQCPGSKTSCPGDSTCCRLHDASYGCCPIKNAVCCQDSVHCCPGGFSCDLVKGVCQKGDKSKPLLKKIPAIPSVVCWCWYLSVHSVKPVCSTQSLSMLGLLIYSTAQK